MAPVEPFICPASLWQNIYHFIPQATRPQNRTDNAPRAIRGIVVGHGNSWLSGPLAGCGKNLIEMAVDMRLRRRNHCEIAIKRLRIPAYAVLCPARWQIVSPMTKAKDIAHGKITTGIRQAGKVFRGQG